MNIKWKIFRVINIMLFILSSIVYIALCTAFFSSDGRTGSDWTIFVIVSFCSLIAIANNLLNQFIFRNHYPDKELPKPLSVVHIIVSFMYAIYLVLLLWQIISFTYEIKNFSEQGTEFIIFFLLPGFLFDVGYYPPDHASWTEACHRQIISKQNSRNDKSYRKQFRTVNSP